MLHEFANELKAELERLRLTGDQDRSRIEAELRKTERGIKRCLAYIVDGDGDPGAVRDQLKKLETAKKELTAALVVQSQDTKVEVHPNAGHLYRRKIEELHQMLDDELSEPQATEIIRSLVDEVVVVPGDVRGQCDVALHGALAQILNFSHQSKTADSTEDGGTFLMVAEEGLEPPTRGL